MTRTWHVLVLAAAVSALAGGEARATCWAEIRDDRASSSSTVRGDFFGDGREVGLVARSTETGCEIGFETAGEGAFKAMPGAGNYADFLGVCRDSVSARDHAVARVSGSWEDWIEIWAAERGAALPVLLYTEFWGEAGPRVPLVADDGACLWRERLRDREVYKTAMAALRVEPGVEPGDRPPGLLPWRPLVADEVRVQLAAVRGVASFEGAVYADAAARESWLVVQILGGALCDGDGAVLLLDRKTGRWKSIYDARTGCRHSLYPMGGMVVAGDRLYASLCVNCSGWGIYEDFEIDLRTNHVRPVRDADAPGPSGETNPVLDDMEILEMFELPGSF